MTRLFFTGFLLLITVTVTAQTSLRKTLSTMPFSARHDLKIPLSDRQGNHVSLPVTLIKGKKDGPVFTVIAGIHGYEYPPIIAVQEFLKDIDISRLEGSLVIVPVANMPAFERRSVFFNPQDVKNLNNVFPGSADGSITEKIAHYFTTEIIPLSDVFLDIHAMPAMPMKICCRSSAIMMLRNMPHRRNMPQNSAKSAGLKPSFPILITSAKTSLLFTLSNRRFRTAKLPSALKAESWEAWKAKP